MASWLGGYSFQVGPDSEHHEADHNTRETSVRIRGYGRDDSNRGSGHWFSRAKTTTTRETIERRVAAGSVISGCVIGNLSHISDATATTAIVVPAARVEKSPTPPHRAKTT